MDYYQKYKSYKRKYNSLKNKIKIFGAGSDNSMEDIIKDALDNLLDPNSDKSFVTAKVDLDEEEKGLAKKINIKKGYVYSYLGPIDKSQKEHISNYIRIIGNNKNLSDMVAELYVDKIIKPYISALNKNSAWITIRAFVAYLEEEYVPRWHRDGYYYKAEEFYEKKVKFPKLIFIIKGPTTLFKITDEETRKKFVEKDRELKQRIDYANFDPKIDVDNRKQLDELLKDQPTETFSNSEVGIFLVGSDEFAAIHSEPEINEDRLFLSIVAGNEEEIEELAQQWKFPFGKPVYKIQGLNLTTIN